MEEAMQADLEILTDVVSRVAEDLAMITDRPFSIEEVEARRDARKAVGEGMIHISYRLSFHVEGQVLHGCVLIPLPDAISLASYLMMEPDDRVEGQRGDEDLDRATKDAIVETGNFIGGAVDAALRRRWDGEVSVRSEGCQGVGPDLVPNFAFSPGAELLVGTVRARLHEYPSFPMVLNFPVLHSD